MGNYAITFARSARKELENLDIDTATKIFHKIEGLSEFLPRIRNIDIDSLLQNFNHIERTLWSPPFIITKVEIAWKSECQMFINR